VPTLADISTQSGILTGVKVVDLSGITAGARSTQILADFGADVIKVESPTRPDPFRHWRAVTGTIGSEVGDLASLPFRVANRNKRGVTVDLKTSAGKEVFRRMVEWGDIVVENFRRGAMDGLGLSFETLKTWNQQIVLLSISSQGTDGPEAQYVSFGGTLEALGGLMSVTGYDATTPTWSTNKVNYPDQLVSSWAPGLAIWAIGEARRTGEGRWIELAQREAVIALLGDLVERDALSGTASHPVGNRGANGTDLCCRCAGEDEWVAVSIPDADAWARTCRVIGTTIATAVRPSADEMEAAVSAWSADLDKHQAMDALQAEGVAAAAVLTSAEITHAEAGLGERVLVDVPTTTCGGSEAQTKWPFDILPFGSPTIRSRAPHLGEQTTSVLVELGYSDEQIETLLVGAVISQYSEADAPAIALTEPS
jgi:formyl-CoA transferase